MSRHIEDEGVEGFKPPFDKLMDTLAKTSQDGMAVSSRAKLPSAPPSREFVTPGGSLIIGRRRGRIEQPNTARVRSHLLCFSIPVGFTEAIQSSFSLRYESTEGAQA